MDAGWIIEAPSTSSGRPPYTKFNDVWFEDCSVTTANGTTKGVDGATIYFWSSNRCMAFEYDNGDSWVQSTTSLTADFEWKEQVDGACILLG